MTWEKEEEWKTEQHSSTNVVHKFEKKLKYLIRLTEFQLLLAKLVDELVDWYCWVIVKEIGKSIYRVINGEHAI